MNPVITKTIIRSKRKTLGIEIGPDSSVIIRAPENTSESTIDAVLRKKMLWIVQKQRLAPIVYKKSKSKEYVDGEGFLFLGESYKLFISNNSGQPLVFNGKEFLLSSIHLLDAKKHFILWYKEQALTIITQRAIHFANILGLNFQKITINTSSKRWGSCGYKGTLNFSWRLVMAPLKVVDYVVLHELTHLHERNHTKLFWQKIRLLLPDYEKQREWLKENGYLLMV